MFYFNIFPYTSLLYYHGYRTVLSKSPVQNRGTYFLSWWEELSSVKESFLAQIPCLWNEDKNGSGSSPQLRTTGKGPPSPRALTVQSAMATLWLHCSLTSSTSLLPSLPLKRFDPEGCASHTLICVSALFSGEADRDAPSWPPPTRIFETKGIFFPPLLELPASPGPVRLCVSSHSAVSHFLNRDVALSQQMPL